MNFKVFAIIPSAGMGRRLGGVKKNYLELLGKPILTRTLAIFEASPLITGIIVVTAKGDTDLVTALCKEHKIKKITEVVEGGAERQDSVFAALKVLPSDANAVIIHDGARPLLSPSMVEEVISGVRKSKAVITGVQPKDTIKKISVDELSEVVTVSETPKREFLISVQTPQGFDAEILKDAYEKAKEDEFIGTDCSSLVERAGHKVIVIPGSYENIKITTPEDLRLAESIIVSREVDLA